MEDERMEAPLTPFLAEYTAAQNKDYISHLPLHIDVTTGNEGTRAKCHIWFPERAGS